LTLDDVEISPRKGQVTVNGKGFKQRTIPLNKASREILRQWLQVRPDSGDRALFINQRGAPAKLRSAQRAVKRIAEQAGLEDVTPHTLRHTFAKSLIDEGVTLEKVAKLLGHSSLDTTRIYVTPSEKDLEEAVESLE
jgi:integrase/recombinase XerC